MQSQKRCKWGLKLGEEHNERETLINFLLKPLTRGFTFSTTITYYLFNKAFVWHFINNSAASLHIISSRQNACSFCGEIYILLIAHFFLFLLVLCLLILLLLFLTRNHFVITSCHDVFAQHVKFWRRFLNMTLEVFYVVQKDYFFHYLCKIYEIKMPKG